MDLCHKFDHILNQGHHDKLGELFAPDAQVTLSAHQQLDRLAGQPLVLISSIAPASWQQMMPS
jgi:hypothetical protein